MARQKTNEAAPPAYETRFERLQEIVLSLESGNLPLEESMTLFKEGMALSRSCREQLDTARHELTILTREGIAPYAAPGEIPPISEDGI